MHYLDVNLSHRFECTGCSLVLEQLLFFQNGQNSQGTQAVARQHILREKGRERENEEK